VRLYVGAGDRKIQAVQPQGSIEVEKERLIYHKDALKGLERGVFNPTSCGILQLWYELQLAPCATIPLHMSRLQNQSSSKGMILIV
jgi:hypothetical protein